MLAELEALRRLGGRGPLFFVDDNFIGNRRAVAALLPRITAWQRQHGRPFDLYTEASLDLASHPELVDAMVEAGFTAVFVGLESPSPESLKAAGKVQNLKVDPAEGVRRLTAARAVGRRAVAFACGPCVSRLVGDGALDDPRRRRQRRQVGACCPPAFLVAVPSIVQHDDDTPSVKGGRAHQPWAEGWRKALLLAADASDYDW